MSDLTESSVAPVSITDTHQHLWDLSRLSLGWVKGSVHLNRSFLLSDYAKEAEGLPITQTLFMEVAVDDGQQVTEAEWVKTLGKPLVGAIIGGKPAAPDFGTYLNTVGAGKNRFIKGVRQTLHGGNPKGMCLEAGFVEGVRLLGERKLTFDLCLRAEDLADGAELAKRLPENQFILDHCGNGNVQGTRADFDLWKRGMEAVAACPNVVCKISGVVVSAKPGAWSAEDLEPFVNFSLEAFGENRVVFGSDWPVCTRTATLRQWVEALQEIVAVRSEKFRRKLFHENAVRVYGLGGKS